MNIVHIAAEAYPISKSGGLGDVMGSLPKYLNQGKRNVHVVIPFHESSFVAEHDWEIVHIQELTFGQDVFRIEIVRETTDALGFATYLVKIPFIFPRNRIYGYQDDASRFILFQMAVLYWLSDWKDQIDIIHCHDHHTGLVPFLCKYANDYQALRKTPTVYTIHNGKYTGAMSLSHRNLLPAFDWSNAGFLEYNNTLNPMVSAVKCAYRVTTVSKGYLEELGAEDSALGHTIREEWDKCSGILNGIDEENWSPEKDVYLDIHYGIKNYSTGKKQNKKELLSPTQLNSDLPLFSFIGRMVNEKGADYLVYAIDAYLSEKTDINFYIIGSGDTQIMEWYQRLYEKYPENIQIYLGYNEQLARRLYASSDFVVMPSRVEPCGLNQMYAMRYGTIPIVRSTGGLKDTVKPIEDGGNGFTFYDASSWEVKLAIQRAHNYQKEKSKETTILKNMKIDFSWNGPAQEYIKLYESLTP